MTLFLASSPLWLSALLVLVIPVALTVCGGLLVRRTVKLEHLIENNEVAGFKFAVIGVVYAVLLGFAVIVVWEKFHDAEAAAVQEASGVITVERLAGGFSETAARAVRQSLSTYAEAVISDEWPAMEHARASPKVSRALNALYATVLAIDPATPHATAAMTALLTQLDIITEGRRTRLMLASGIVPDVLWLVLGGGAVITLSFTFFFGTRSVRAQALMTGILATMVFMALLVVVVINYPFAGPVRVTPDILESALTGFADGH
ncbi:MAG TPA: DUF4239 domain-containing protein [Stellaceae bacterium]|nr:DUF4239 domain-containing protein [Stellaceae bacterium]